MPRDKSIWWRLPATPGFQDWRLAADMLNAYEIEAVRDALESVFVALGYNNWMIYGAKSNEPPTWLGGRVHEPAQTAQEGQASDHEVSK